MTLDSFLPVIGAVTVVVGLVSGCAVNADPASQGASPQSAADSYRSSAETDATPSATVDTPVASRCQPLAGDTRTDLVCHRWHCDREGLAAVTWTGDKASCSAGAIDEASYARALDLLNTYRFLAGVPELTLDSRWNRPAQSCALLAQANSALSHHPGSDWSCWSELGARASAVSLIANRSAPLAIDPFIEDAGNEATMVHRRWLLGENLRRVGVGSTNGFSCLVVDGREFEPTEKRDAGVAERNEDEAKTATMRAWAAWPPAGPVPLDVFTSGQLDARGWTIQSATQVLDGATISVSVGGEPRPVTVMGLEPTFGSLSAVRFIPRGWSTTAGARYDVRVKRGPIVIEYTVAPVDC